MASALTLSTSPAIAAGSVTFTQTNLVSDIPGMAATTDRNLVNPWGITLGLNSGLWVIVLCMTQLNLSARVYHRTQSVKLARTIADLAWSEEIRSVHLAEALQYRPKLMIG